MFVRTLSILGAAWAVLFLSSCRTANTPRDLPAQEPASQPSRVITLIQSMQDGTYAGRDFPKLDWDDVGPLLELANSEVPLRSFPTNPLSSQSQPTCSTGMMALWLVEGIRRDQAGGYPSLNPLCLSENPSQAAWIELSEANRKLAAEAYCRWWEQNVAVPVETRRRIDPLDGTGLYWY